MTQHTPAPWILGEYDEHLGYDCMTGGVRAGPVVLDGNTYGQGACEPIEAAALARMMADARLIAASPRLLAELQRVMSYPAVRDALECDDNDAAIAAIAAATGTPT